MLNAFPFQVLCTVPLFSERKTTNMLLSIFISFTVATVVYAVLGIVLLPYLKIFVKSRLVKRRVEAYAIVLNIESTGCCNGNLPQVRMQLKVQPHMGRKFIAEIKQVVTPALSNLKTGKCIKVKYNPRNLKDITVMP
jgi:hypothetical protein